MGDTTVADFEAICLEIKERRAAVAAKKAERDKLQEELDEIETKAMAMLELSGKTSYKSEHGTVYTSSKESVKLPKSLEDKAEFFAYLKSKNIYDEVINVNSSWLNSHYKEEREKALEVGNILFTIPGINEVTTNPVVGFRAGK